jgi:hypothetical protein
MSNSLSPDNSVFLQTVVNNPVDGTFINDATVKVNIYDSDDVLVAGVWPQTLVYVAASDGTYRITLDPISGLVVGDLYRVQFFSTNPSLLLADCDINVRATDRICSEDNEVFTSPTNYESRITVNEAGIAANVISIATNVTDIANLDSIKATQEDTVALMAAHTKKTYVAGDIIEVDAYTSGNGGAGKWKAVLTSGVTPNTYNIVIGTGIAANILISFVLQDPDTYINMSSWSVSPSTVDVGLIATSAQTQFPMKKQVYPIALEATPLVIKTQVDFDSSGVNTFNQGPQIEGAGMGLTVFDNQVSSAPMFDLGAGGVAGTNFLMAAKLKGFKIISTTGSSQIGVKFLTSYMVKLEQFHIDGLAGNGLEIPTVSGDGDGSNMLELDQVRIENCTGWGIKADGNPNRNEFSFLHMNQVFIQACGTNEGVDVTGVSKANPAVVTAVGHGRINGDIITLQAVGSTAKGITSASTTNPVVVTSPGHGYANGVSITIEKVKGMVEINVGNLTTANITATTYELLGVDGTNFHDYEVGSESGFSRDGMVEVNDIKYTVANKTANTFELSGINSSGFTVYTTGGVTGPYIPTSGGMIWKGQLLTSNHLALTTNHNCAMFIKGESGLGQSVDLQNSTIENNHRRNLLCTGVKAFKSRGLQQYNSRAEFPAYVGIEFDGIEVVSNVDIKGSVVRAISAHSFFKAFKIGGTNADLSNCSVVNTEFDDYDHPGQLRYEGWKDKPTCIVHKDTAQNITSSPTVLLYNVADSDEQSIFSFTASTSRFSIPYPALFNFKGKFTVTAMADAKTVTITLFNLSTGLPVQTILKSSDSIAVQTFDFDFNAVLGTTGLTRTYEIRFSSDDIDRALDVTVGEVGYNTLIITRLEKQV